MTLVKEWSSPPPANCDLCGTVITDVFIDGATYYGKWGIICPLCHIARGVGLGLGKGQKYQQNAAGAFVKVEG